MTKHKPIDLASFVVLFYDRIGNSHYAGSLNSLSKVMNIDIKTLKLYIASLEEIGHFEKWTKKNQTIFHCKSVKCALTDILSMDRDSKHIHLYRPYGRKRRFNRTKNYKYENIGKAKTAVKEAILLHKLKQQNHHVQKAIIVKKVDKGQRVSGSAYKWYQRMYKQGKLEVFRTHRRDVITGSRHIASKILHTSKSDAHKTLKRLESKGNFVLKPVRKVCRRIRQNEGEKFNESFAKIELQHINDETRDNFKVFLNKKTMKLNYFIGTVVLFGFV